MEKLSIKEKIGQKFLVGTTKKEEIPKVIELVKNYSIGGIVLYKNNYNSFSELIDLVNLFKSSNKDNSIPLFISIDQEGGRVNRLPITAIKNAYSFNKKSGDLIERRAEITANLLTKCGINMNFDPVLDLKLQPDNHAIGNRAYSSSCEEIIRITDIIVKKYYSYNLIPVIKHFPGQGSLKVDSHVNLPVIKDFSINLKKDLMPFLYHIKKDIPAIMVGHISIKKLTSPYPATLSKTLIQDFLKEKLEFKNIIITDELSMRSVRYRFGRKNSIIKAINAGCDIIMYKYFSGFPKVLTSLEKLYEKGRLDTSALDESTLKILDVKKNFNIQDKKIENGINVEEFTKQIEDLNKEVSE